MTPWLIFGAGGTGVGALTAEIALKQRRPLYVLVRNAQAAERLREKGARVIIGDACNAERVAEACAMAGEHALVISTLGGQKEYLANRTIIDTAENARLTRMILVTSLGCGDSWPWLSERAKAAFGQAVREKSLAESWLQTSTLDFAILRPGGLLDGPATGKAELSQGEEAHGLVMRADVAARIAGLAGRPALNRKIYSLVEPGLKP
ncbi:NAD(P)H-binding protein [Dryocola sp. BD586]|uniref:NAD(P)H-binding protein n=1 Tax=Dryocola sp. BD586 TaxID=3133271 RepID=UPI003F4F6A9B